MQFLYAISEHVHVITYTLNLKNSLFYNTNQENFMTQVKSIMSKNVKSIAAGSSLSDAYSLMKEARIRHLPILNEDGEVSGIISYKNLLTNPSVLAMPVEFFMTFPVVEIHENTPLKNAILKMLEEKISSLLITNDKFEVVGIVTTDDILWQLASQLKPDSDETENTASILTKGAETIGEIARLLSQAGI